VLIFFHAARPLSIELCRHRQTGWKGIAQGTVCVVRRALGQSFSLDAPGYFAPVLMEHYQGKLLGIFDSGAEKRIVSSLRSLPRRRSSRLTRSRTAETMKLAESLLQKAKVSGDILQLQFPHDFPVHLFYDGLLRVSGWGQLDIHFPDW